MEQGSSSFRRQLAQELEHWRAEGLVSPDQAERLRERYGLGALAQESRGALLTAVYVIGALLVAGGVISFVAAHWDQMPRAVKVAVIFAAMLGAHGAGWWFWRVRASHPRLGHGLVFLGTLIFGANIGLMAQIFHIRSDFYNGFGAWALGALLMAYAAASLPNLLVAILASFIWFCGWTYDHRAAVSFYPVLAAALFLPFAWWRRSAAAFAATALTAGTAWVVAAGMQGNSPAPCLLAMTGFGGLLFGFGMWALESPRSRLFAPTALALGVMALVGATYVFSFHEMARESLRERLWRAPDPIWMVPVGALYAAMVLAWAGGLGVALRRRDLRPLAAAALLAVLLPAVGLAARMDTLLTFFVNAAAVVLAAALILTGVTQLRRGLFWAGVLYALLLVITRFLEYDTGLMLKSAAFLLCGLAVIYGGVQFENRLRARRPGHE